MFTIKILIITPTNSRESSSESEQYSSDGSSEDSDPIAYRKSHSVLPNLEPPLQGPYVNVFVDGACSYNGRSEPRAGIDV